MDGSLKSDKVIMAMNYSSTNGFRYGEDGYNLPYTMYNEYIDLYLEKSWSGTVDINGIEAKS